MLDRCVSTHLSFDVHATIHTNLYPKTQAQKPKMR